jgi:hypothetical protein
MSTPAHELEPEPLYERDFHAWAMEQRDLLARSRLGELDLEHLIEEVDYMARRERQRLESNTEVVLAHLLKYRYQPQRRSNRWRATLVEHRRRIHVALRDSPSLRPYLEDALADCYRHARSKALAETGLDDAALPVQNPFGLDQVLDSDFLPD